MDGTQQEAVLGEQNTRMHMSNQLSGDLQRGFGPTEHKTGLSQEVHAFLGKLDRCPESIEEPEEEVDRLILYQAVEEVSMENSIEPGTLMGDVSGEFLQSRDMAETSREEGSLEDSELADQVDEISEGHMGHISLAEPCNEVSDKAVKELDSKSPELELDSFYSECPSTSLSSPAGPSKSNDTTVNSAGVKPEVSVDQEDNKSKCLLFSFQDKDGQDTKPLDLKFSILPDSAGETKTEQLEMPIKVEETEEELEEALTTFPDTSEVKPSRFLAYAVKSEDLVTKCEQLDFHQDILDTKPEDLTLPVKPENFDTKPEILQFATYSEGTEIKPEAKPAVLGVETKPEGLRLTAFPDMSAVKPEAKPESLEFTTYPDSSEIKREAKPQGLELTALHQIKAETKQELLEADSTVLTPKLEQADALAEASDSLAAKGQVKEERPSSPGRIGQRTSSWLCYL